MSVLSPYRRDDCSLSAQPRRRPPSQQRCLADSQQPDAHRPRRYRVPRADVKAGARPAAGSSAAWNGTSNARSNHLVTNPSTAPDGNDLGLRCHNLANCHRRRRTPPGAPQAGITPRTRPVSQLPACYSIPEMAHRSHHKTDCTHRTIRGGSGLLELPVEVSVPMLGTRALHPDNLSIPDVSQFQYCASDDVTTADRNVLFLVVSQPLVSAYSVGVLRSAS